MKQHLWIERQIKECRLKFFGVPHKPNKAQKALLQKVGKAEVTPLKAVLNRMNLLNVKKALDKAEKPKKIADKPFFIPLGFNTSDQTPDKGVFTNGRSFMHALEKKGWERLGSGAFSWVLGKKGSDKVIKISKGSDGGWMEYIKWATDNGFAGTFAPKVFSYKWVKGSDYSFSICSMERLENTIYNTSSQADVYLLHTLVKHKMSYQNPNAGVLADLLQPGIEKFTTALQDKFGKRGLDLHRGNFMSRTGGGIVCIDPVSAGSPYTSRFRLADYGKQLLTAVQYSAVAQ